MGSDAEKKPDRAERREEIKLRLEYAKALLSLVGIVSIVFAALQWQAANRAAEAGNRAALLSLYQRVASEWRDQLRALVEKPHIVPYFLDGKQLKPDDPNRDVVLAFADVRLDTMDAILTYASLGGYGDQIQGWRNTVADAFRSSPVLCERVRSVSSNYGLVVPLANRACTENSETR